MLLSLYITTTLAYYITKRTGRELTNCWLSKSDAFCAAAGRQETPVSSLHEACFIGLDSNGIVRRTQRRVISQAWGDSDAPAAWARAEETLVPLPDDCSMTGPANRLADEANAPLI